MRRVPILLLLGVLAAVGLTACMSDDDDSAASARESRRSAALVSTGTGNPGGYQLTIDTITKAGQAILVDGFSWGATNPGATATGTATGKVQFQELKVVKRVDEVSPLLMQHCANGKHLTSAILTVAKPSTTSAGVKYMTVTLEDVFISSVQLSGSNPDVPQEEVTLTFGRMSYDASSLDEKTGKTGTTNTASWDLSATAK